MKPILYKYPSTPVLPHSPGSRGNVLFNTAHFENKNIVITEKMDGECTSLYHNYIHARSLNSGYHASREWINNFHGTISHTIPYDWRVCGENVYAKHSIAYDMLPSYFMVFSIWIQDKCLSWEDTVEYTELLEMITVPVLYQGVWCEDVLADIIKNIDTTKSEGFVVRISDSFNFSDFEKNIAKWVREDHVQTNKHWKHQKVIPNQIVPIK